MADWPPLGERGYRTWAPLAVLWVGYLGAVWVNQQRHEDIVAPLGVLPVIATGLLLGRRIGLFGGLFVMVASFAIHMVHGAGDTPAQDIAENAFRWSVGLALGYGSGALAELYWRERRHANDLRQHEAELARSQARLTGILDSQAALIVRIDGDNRITYMNDAYQRAFGLKVGDVFWVKVHPDDEAKTKEAMLALQAPPYRCSVEQRCDVKGQWRWILWQDSVVHDADGRVVEIQGVGFDVTDRRVAEQRVVESEERYRLAAQATRDVIWDLEMATGRMSWGGSMHEVFGYPLPQLAPDLSSWEERIHPDDRARTVESFVGTLLAGEPQWQAEYRFRRADGTYATVVDRGFLLRNEAGKAVRAVGAMEDVTQEREAQAKAREAERLREAARFKTQFLNNAAHELATPLTPLLLQLASLRPTLRPEQQRRFELLERNVTRLGRLVEDLLDAARLESGHLKLRIFPTRLDDLAKRAVASFEAQSGDTGVAIILEAPDGPVEVPCDEVRVEQIVFNLLHNALKFTPREGKVHVRVAMDGPHAVLSVQDTGIGMDASQLARLFQPFSQVHDPNNIRPGGTGLGLFVARGIAEQHGGSLQATSPGVGHGARFTLRLPLVAAASGRDAANGHDLNGEAEAAPSVAASPVSPTATAASPTPSPAASSATPSAAPSAPSAKRRRPSQEAP